MPPSAAHRPSIAISLRSRVAILANLLRAAIECGALLDPWNTLGFNGQYSLFPAIENSVHDHRVDELLDMVGDIFMLYVRIYKAAAATGETALEQTLSENLAALASWWDKFAAGQLDSIDGISGQATLESERVAAAFAWHGAGRGRDLALAAARRAVPLAQGLRFGH